VSTRVRYAPSPTGTLHVGGAHTVLFNLLFARRTGGRFILRFEDTDRTRSSEASERAICEGLRWLGLQWDEGVDIGGPYGPYRQTERLPLYQEAAARLLRAGAAYECFCTPEELEARREEARREGRPPKYDGRCRDLSEAQRITLRAQGRTPALRLRLPAPGKLVVHDLIYGDVEFDTAELDDFVIVKSDGLPAYNFGVVVDDTAMAITHVIRGDEHLSNTPKQLLIYRALGYDLPVFAHVPMILGRDRHKLSKRHGATSVDEFRDRGFLPEALVNYLALLGWSDPDGREILSFDDMAQAFSLDRVSKSAAVYDEEKMTWMNAQHMRLLPPAELCARAASWLDAAGLPWRQADPAWLASVITAVVERVRTLAELPDAIGYFFAPPRALDPDGVRRHMRESTPELLRAAASRIEALPAFSAGAAEAAYRALAEERGIKPAEIIHPTRLVLTGRTVGPSLFLVLELLGRDESCRRLRAVGLPAA
jgi:glutamyl-tRNA synthetase